MTVFISCVLTHGRRNQNVYIHRNEISCEQTNDLQARNQPPNGNWQESSWDIRNISFSFYFANTGCVCSWILNTTHIKTYIANTHSAFLSKQKSLNDNFISARLAVIWSVRKILYFIFQWKLPNESLAMAVFSNNSWPFAFVFLCLL